MKTTLISVTADHIKRGKRKEKDHCPVRVAMQEAQFRVAMVTYANIGWWNHGDWDIPTPKKVRRWLEALDAGKPTKPFSFRMKRPDLEVAPSQVGVS